jgi:hypothetical protein
MASIRWPVLLLTGTFAASACGAHPSPSPSVLPPQRDGVAHEDTTCVVEADSLRRVVVDLESSPGDTLVSGRRFSAVYPAISPPYAAGAGWFVRQEPILFGGRRYFGWDYPPRVIAPEHLYRVGWYEGIPLFAEVGDAVPAVIFVPVRPGCVFLAFRGLQLGPADR